MHGNDPRNHDHSQHGIDNGRYPCLYVPNDSAAVKIVILKNKLAENITHPASVLRMGSVTVCHQLDEAGTSEDTYTGN